MSIDWTVWPRNNRHAGAAVHIGVVLDNLSGGGSERVAIRLANRWAAAGRRVTLYVAVEEGPLRAIVADDVVVRPILPWFGESGLRPARLGHAIACMVLGDKPDVIVGPGNSHIQILSKLAASLGKDRPPIVCKISNPLIRADRSPLRQAIFGAILRRRCAAFDHMVAMSPALMAEAAKVLRHSTISCLAEPTLDDPRLGFRREQHGSGGRSVLCIGRLEPQKNFTLALDALALMPPDVTITFLGDGSERSALEARAAALGLGERVVFAGHVDPVAPYIGMADALLCTSTFEGYPAALVEALAAGVPVVTTACSPAIPEIMLDPSFGEVVAQADRVSLATSLFSVLEEERRPSGQALASLRRRHDADQCAAGWLSLLDRTVASRSTMPEAEELEPLREALAA